jgi:hypothetical protein
MGGQWRVINEHRAGPPFPKTRCREQVTNMSSLRPSIDDVWRRLREFEGRGFETKTGKPFTYEISGDVLHPSRTKYNVSKGEFRKALEFVPFDGPGAVNRLVRGPAYVWAVLHDTRIRRDDW